LKGYGEKGGDKQVAGWAFKKNVTCIKRKEVGTGSPELSCVVENVATGGGNDHGVCSQVLVLGGQRHTEAIVDLDLGHSYRKRKGV